MSILCQRSQPCLLPWFPLESFPLNQHEHPENAGSKSENRSREGGVWSSIQSLTNNSHDSLNGKELADDKNQIFVHPLAKRSAAALSKESLEMCTESLGSETGSESSDDIPPFSSTVEGSRSIGKLKCREREFTGKLIPSRSFPPPLRTISGSDSVRMRPHREGGRLVIKAVNVASSNGYFQADRVDGRLRLCLVNESSLDYGNEKVDEGDGLGYYGNAGDDVDGVDDDDDGNDGVWVEGIRGNSGKVEGESGIGEIQRPSRCKEGSWWAWEEKDLQLGAIS